MSSTVQLVEERGQEPASRHIQVEFNLEEATEFLQRHRNYVGAGLGLFCFTSVVCTLILSLAAVLPHQLRPSTIGDAASPETELHMPSGPFWLGAPARMWQTARGDSRIGAKDLLQQKPDVLLLPDFEFNGPVISISNMRGQTIEGFGGAFSEATARVYRELPAQQQKAVLEGYFGESGIGYTLGRVDINADFSPASFHDDLARSLRVEIPFVKEVHEMLKAQGKKFRLLATQWSVPSWMQSNSKVEPRRPCLRHDVSAAWANYFVRWITALKDEDIPVWAVTVQHELENDEEWAACLLTPEEEADFLGNVFGPSLRSAHPELLVFYSDHFKDHLSKWGNLMQTHPTAALYAAGVSFQASSDADFEAAEKIHHEIPRAQLLANQAVGMQRQWRWHEGASVKNGDWSVGEDYAYDILDDLNVGSIGWIDWNLLINEEHIGPNHVNNVWDAAMNLVLNGDGSETYMDNVWDAAMMADFSTGEVHRHPQYYFIGQVSKFIIPGSVHLKSTVLSHGVQEEVHKKKSDGSKSKGRGRMSCSEQKGLRSTSFLRPDNFIATVVLNCGDEDVDFKLQEGVRAIRASVPKHSIQTYLFEQKGESPFRPHGDISIAGGKQENAPFIGANLGGWLLLEEWMWASEMTDKDIRDEHGFIQKHGGPKDPRAVNLMREHWESFVTEEDLDRLQWFGVTHVRVPIGWWLVDYDPNDGFVDGGERYLFRLMGWLQKRGMRALLDLHALPGSQAANQSFTGVYSPSAGFFEQSYFYNRGKQAMEKLAKLILKYEANPMTAGVVLGMELVNEPEWKKWEASPGLRELYETMVPRLRRLLPANRFALFLNFMEAPRTTGPRWLASMRARDPSIWDNVIYDAHLYHSYGDDNKPGREWNDQVDSCKTCCRDPHILAPLVDAGVPMSIGEYSLNTGFPGSPDFFVEYLKNQLSLWATLPGMVGSFFWNHRILRERGGWFKEMSLLELLAPNGPLPQISDLNFTVRCPGKDLSKCPKYDPNKVLWTDSCAWEGDPQLPESTIQLNQQVASGQLPV